MEAEPLPPPILSSPLKGLQLTGSTLAEELGPDRQLLVFLRHLG